MRKIALLLSSVLVFALLVNFTNVQASPAPDPEVQRVGYVVAYTPGLSITIVDKDGNQFTFTLTSELEVLPPELANTLAVGSYVTVIAPNNVPGGKNIAKKIVIHPQPPSSFSSPTPVPTDTSTATLVPTEVASETPVGTGSPTETATATITPSVTEIETPTATPSGGSPTTTSSQSGSPIAGFLDWLVSLFNQIFSPSG